VLALVVDDDPVIRAYVRAILNAENFETREAEDGRPALDLVNRLDGNVDLIVTDVHMPGLDGIGLANSVRASFPFVQIILMSGYENNESPFDFVAKPFTWAAMTAAVRRVMLRRLRVA
jgi:two-component system cell cycle sensor histidine kinase/response regulator CckA